MFAHQAQRLSIKTRTSAITISSGTRDSKIKDGEDVDVPRSPVWESQIDSQSLSPQVQRSTESKDNCWKGVTQFRLNKKLFHKYETHNLQIIIMISIVLKMFLILKLWEIILCRLYFRILKIFRGGWSVWISKYKIWDYWCDFITSKRIVWNGTVWVTRDRISNEKFAWIHRNSVHLKFHLSRLGL